MNSDRSTHPKSILFLCAGNSCRSQMAEAIARHYLKDFDFIASAGSHPTLLRESVIQVLHELGISTAGQYSKHVDTLSDREWDYVVTLCGDGMACPIPPKHKKLIHAPMPDPTGATGPEERVLQAFRDVRDQILKYVRNREFEKT